MQIQILVNDDGDQIKTDFVVDVTSSVAEIKARIESIFNIPVDQQCLMMPGKELHNEQTVNNINVQRSHTLRVQLSFQVNSPSPFIPGQLSGPFHSRSTLLPLSFQFNSPSPFIPGQPSNLIRNPPI